MTVQPIVASAVDATKAFKGLDADWMPGEVDFIQGFHFVRAPSMVARMNRVLGYGNWDVPRTMPTSTFDGTRWEITVRIRVLVDAEDTTSWEWLEFSAGSGEPDMREGADHRDKAHKHPGTDAFVVDGRDHDREAEGKGGTVGALKKVGLLYFWPHLADKSQQGRWPKETEAGKAAAAGEPEIPREEIRPTCSKCHAIAVRKTAGAKSKNPGKMFWTCPKSTREDDHKCFAWDETFDWEDRLEKWTGARKELDEVPF